MTRGKDDNFKTSEEVSYSLGYTHGFITGCSIGIVLAFSCAFVVGILDYLGYI